MTTTVETLKPTLKYLRQFLDTHHKTYRVAMTEAGGARYGRDGEPYANFNEVVGYIRDIVLNAETNFSNLRIPDGFPTPARFIDEATAFRNMADMHAAKLLKINKGHGDAWFDEVENAYTMCTEVRDAIDHALELGNVSVTEPALKRLVRLVERLPEVSRNLVKERRHEKRDTLDVRDEYDVQDLMRAFLHLEFDDVRAEEYCPSYAATSSRVDFLIWPEKIAVEVKYAKKSHSQRKIADELIVDIARYQKHQDANHLVCVIWNTEHTLHNPVALKSDIESGSNGFVTVLALD
ncbi:hypothetical protein [Paraburkholderia ribeironis]|nr:hypothetical protein [Paraburkholderia ribeironis]